MTCACVIRESTGGGAISVAAIANVARYEATPRDKRRAVGGRPSERKLMISSNSHSWNS